MVPNCSPGHDMSIGTQHDLPRSKFQVDLSNDLSLPVPVAQLVERWTPCGESTRRGYKKSAGSRRDGRLIFMSLLTGIVAVGGRPQLGEVGRGPDVCGYVRTLNIRL